MRIRAEHNENEQQLLQMLLDLPNKILYHHEIEGLAQLILHDVSHDHHFGFKRASYLVDSPEFDSLRGVAGFAEGECDYHKEDLWSDPRSFLHDMREARFHNELLKLTRQSVKKDVLHAGKQELIRGVAHDLGMVNPWVYSFDMRHGNHGILIVEEGVKQLDEDDHELLTHVAAMLGLCHA